jgi:uncharacterized protein YecE (DUF72 family)
VAGWSIPNKHSDYFSAHGSHLSRYASRFPAVEINSSFYKSHRTRTYARWNTEVPRDFRFAVKLPKAVTHERRLEHAEELVERFLTEATTLGDKLGPLLIQLPPSLAFSIKVAKQFFLVLRSRFAGPLAIEPRHRSWFDSAAEALIQEFRVARVGADPAILPVAALPGGWDGLVYYRLHGSPQMYFSKYSDEHLERLANELVQRASSADVWCIFDNTAKYAATENALKTLGLATGTRA